MIVWKYILLVQVPLTTLQKIMRIILLFYLITHIKCIRVGKVKILKPLLGKRKKSLMFFNKYLSE